MPETLHFGPLLIDGQLLSTIIALVVVYAGLSLWLRTLPKHQVLCELYLNFFMIIAITWKFGLFVFEPKKVMEHPQSILLMSGSIREIIIGALLAGAYCVWVIRKKRIPWLAVLDASVIAWLIYSLVHSMLVPRFGMETTLPWGIRILETGLAYHPVNAYKAIGMTAILVWLWRLHGHIGNGVTGARGLIFAGVVTLAVSLFVREQVVLLYLSFDQLVGLMQIIAGYVLHPRSILKAEGNKIQDKKLDGLNRPAE